MSVLVDIGIDKWYKASCHPIWGSLYMYWNEIIVYMCFLTRSRCSVIFCYNDTTAHLTSACDHVVTERKEVKVFISEFWRSRKIRYDSVPVLILFLFCFPEFLSVCLMKVITNDQERESSSFAQRNWDTGYPTSNIQWLHLSPPLTHYWLVESGNSTTSFMEEFVS